MPLLLLSCLTKRFSPTNPFTPMLAVLFNLPKWLLVVIAIGVFCGQCEQFKCRLLGCDSSSVVQSASGDHHTGGDPSSQTDHHCTCQCHFGTMAPCESVPLCATPQLAQEAEMVEYSDHVPDSPYADIEHPPQLA